MPPSPTPQTTRAATATSPEQVHTGSAVSAGMDLHDEPGHLIRRAHQLAVSTFHETHGRDVTPVQYAVLRVLLNEPGIDQVTLAQRVALDTSTTADIATRLESKGWIERVLLARRQRSLHLTPTGEAILAGMVPRVAPMHHQLLQSLEPAEQAEFMRLLRKFVRLNERSRTGEASEPPVGIPGKP